MLPETKPILFNCPKEFDEIEIFPVHDLHYGSGPSKLITNSPFK